MSVVLPAYLVYVLLFAWTPFTWSVDSFDSIAAQLTRRFEGVSALSRATLWDIWTNIVFFVPFGFLTVLLRRVSERTWYVKILWVAALSATLSSMIEVGQVFLPRAPSFVDMVYNTLGGVAGGLVGIYGHACLLTYGARWFGYFGTRTASGLMLGGYLLFAGVSLALPLPLPHNFANWDSTYPLLIGNERTMDRPWHGTIYLVAVFEHALSPAEVSVNFAAGPFPDQQDGRALNGLLFYYDFADRAGSIVHDRAGKGSPLNLHIRDPSRATWIAPRGLALRGNTVIMSQEVADTLARGRFAAHPELSVEIWMAPADLVQSGPARLASYSANLTARNFTVGQQGRDVVFRLRTPVSGVNGTRPELATHDSPLTSGVHHVIATYRAGIETIYVDGVEHAQLLLRSQDSLSDLIGELVGRPYLWLVDSVLIFPLGLFAGIVSSRVLPQHLRGWAPLLGFVSAMAGFLMIHVLRWETLGSPLTPSVVMVGTVTLLASCVVLPAQSERP